MFGPINAAALYHWKAVRARQPIDEYGHNHFRHVIRNVDSRAVLVPERREAN
jgi:hypothetical protein